MNKKEMDAVRKEFLYISAILKNKELFNKLENGEAEYKKLCERKKYLTKEFMRGCRDNYKAKRASTI